MKQRRWGVGIILGLLVALGGCGAPAAPLPSPTAQPFALTSPAFADGASIPERSSCHGANSSPPLAWGPPPAGTRGLVLAVDDPDAVGVVGYVWQHWLVYGLPAEARGLAEGIPQDPQLPDGGRQGQNSGKTLGYAGPCPPAGQKHTYVFTLYAVDLTLDVAPGATRAEVMQAISGHILAKAELRGSYASP